LVADDQRSAALSARYVLVATGRLSRPVLEWLRGQALAGVFFQIPVELRGMVVPVLAALAALLACRLAMEKASARPVGEWEAMFAADENEFRITTKDTMTSFVSPFGGGAVAVVPPEKRPREEDVLMDRMDQLMQQQQQMNARQMQSQPRQWQPQPGRQFQQMVKPPTIKGACWGCGGVGHMQGNCPMKGVVVKTETKH
jgi:hypothetical protein